MARYRNWGVLRISTSKVTDNCLVYYGYPNFNTSAPTLAQLEKMLYLCTRNSGKAQGGRRLPDVVSRRVTNIMRNKKYGEDFV